MRTAQWQIAIFSTLIFTCCWTSYKYELMETLAKKFIENSCYYDGKAYTVGVVIETAQGIKCECAATASDPFPTWVIGRWS